MAPPTKVKPTPKGAGYHPSESLLRDVVQNAAVGIALVSGDDRITYVNRTFGEMFGCEPEECFGVRREDIIRSTLAESAAEPPENLVSGDARRHQTERQYLRRDGSRFWGLASMSALRTEDLDGGPKFIVQIVDVDRQKQAEARWNFALEGAGQGVWDRDFRTGSMFYSRTWRLMRGLGPDEEIDGSDTEWMKRVHPEDLPRIREASRLQVSGESGVNFLEYRERRRDGRWMWIASRGRTIEWMEDGTPARIIGTDTDITSLKKVEAELAEEKERLSVTLKSIGDGVISTDRWGKITFMNPVAEHLTGWQAADVVGKGVEEVFRLVGESTGTAGAAPVAQCLQQLKNVFLEEDMLMLSRTGERRNLRGSAAPVRMPDGSVLGAVLVFQDVTEARQLQRELAYAARHDSLTGLLNRAAFEKALSEVCAEAARGEREHALCFIDLDRFKAVNDAAGHAAGDDLLRQVTNTIRRAVRGRDLAGRLGGDEFAVLLVDCPLADAGKIAEQILAAIAATRFVWEGHVHTVGASAGITAVTASSTSVAELMREADAACYAAKAAGRNRVEIHRPDLRMATEAKSA
jgi:diguanylate cyclase (GGDEF)-like protein/PAS domain S-box-containing protein